MKFLNIVENAYASDRNPHKIGIFIRAKRRTVTLTDGKGNFWETEKGDHLKIVGNVLTAALNESVPQAIETTAQPSETAADKGLRE